MRLPQRGTSGKEPGKERPGAHGQPPPELMGTHLPSSPAHRFPNPPAEAPAWHTLGESERRCLTSCGGSGGKENWEQLSESKSQGD